MGRIRSIAPHSPVKPILREADFAPHMSRTDIVGCASRGDPSVGTLPLDDGNKDDRGGEHGWTKREH